MGRGTWDLQTCVSWEDVWPTDVCVVRGRGTYRRVFREMTWDLQTCVSWEDVGPTDVCFVTGRGTYWRVCRDRTWDLRTVCPGGQQSSTYGKKLLSVTPVMRSLSDIHSHHPPVGGNCSLLRPCNCIYIYNSRNHCYTDKIIEILLPITDKWEIYGLFSVRIHFKAQPRG